MGCMDVLYERPGREVLRGEVLCGVRSIVVVSGERWQVVRVEVDLDAASAVVSLRPASGSVEEEHRMTPGEVLEELLGAVGEVRSSWAKGHLRWSGTTMKRARVELGERLLVRRGPGNGKHGRPPVFLSMVP